jgi:hypothetical protein
VGEMLGNELYGFLRVVSFGRLEAVGGLGDCAVS